jgi:plastocyanin
MLRSIFLLGGLMLAGSTQAASLNVSVADTAGSPLVDAVIFAKPLGASPAGKPRGAIVDQVNKEFVPLVSVVQAGTPITFPNKDNIRHHVYSFSVPKVFDLKLYSGVPASPVVFDKPGLVVLGCNIHDWMLAYVLVVDTPYFAKTDDKGGAKIDSLPAGEYEISAWHPRLQGAFQVLKGKADSAAPLVFRLPLSAHAPGAR